MTPRPSKLVVTGARLTDMGRRRHAVCGACLAIDEGRFDPNMEGGSMCLNCGRFELMGTFQAVLAGMIRTEG